jgi:hypothetical protein
VYSMAQTILFSPGFFLKEEFNRAVMQMHAGGIISKSMIKLIGGYPSSDVSRRNKWLFIISPLNKN